MARKPAAAEAKQNVTLRLHRDTIRRARMLAAREGVSLSDLFDRLTRRRDGRTSGREAAKERLIALARAGIEMGPGRFLTREEAHER